MQTKRREFVIFGSKDTAKTFCSNHIQTAKYNIITFLPFNLAIQFSKLANVYFLIITFLQMVKMISITDGEPTTLTGLVPVIMVSMIKDLLEDLKRRSEDTIENDQKVQRIDKKTHGFQDDRWKNLKVGQVIKVNKNDRFPADIILLKSSDPAGIAYVETVNLDGETNLKHKQAIRDMQDAILSPADASTINGSIYCDLPNDQLYYFEGIMSLSVQNSPFDYKYNIDYDQLMLRGSSLKITQWVYGIVVYTGQETKIKQNDTKKSKQKRSQMDSKMNWSILYVFSIQVVIACLGALLGMVFDHENANTAYYLDLKQEFDPKEDAMLQKLPFLIFFIRMGTWILLLTNFVPISLLVTVEMVKYIQAIFIEWDAHMITEKTGASAIVQQSSLNEELGQISYIFSDKTGTLTCNHMVFKKMSIFGDVYGNDNEDCEDAVAKDCTNFNMSDSNFKRILTEKVNTNREYYNAQRYLYHLALCHTIVTSKDPRDETKIILNSSSPDELSLLNAAKYYGVRFVERNQFNELVIQDEYDAEFSSGVAAGGRSLAGRSLLS